MLLAVRASRSRFSRQSRAVLPIAQISTSWPLASDNPGDVSDSKTDSVQIALRRNSGYRAGVWRSDKHGFAFDLGEPVLVPRALCVRDHCHGSEQTPRQGWLPSV
jgi:hypothetical protein